jgi:glycosyltransferase involved in cell wall biosynthesis
MTGAAVVIDSHPVAFAFDGSPFDRVMLPLLRLLASRVDACLVTTDELREQVQRWGGSGLVFHEAPPEWSADGPRPKVEPGSVLFVSTFAPDEPLVEVLGAARLLPNVRFRITGDLRRLSPGVRQLAPGNVEWLGYLTGDSYPGALRQAQVVLTLTERRQSVPRSAYEAVYAERPLVTTDWPHMAELFPHAMRVTNNANSIAQGLRRALASNGELQEAARAALELQLARWDGQVEQLRRAIGAPNGRDQE